MQITTAYRTPHLYSPGWQLEKTRSNEYGYVDTPIERGRTEDVARHLPDDIKSMLMDVDMSAIDPVALSQLAGKLHWAGYLSHMAWERLGEFQIDYTGPLDPLALTEKALKDIRGVDDVMYDLAIRMDEAAIDAAKGIRQLIDYLHGRQIDAWA